MHLARSLSTGFNGGWRYTNRPDGSCRIAFVHTVQTDGVQYVNRYRCTIVLGRSRLGPALCPHYLQ